MFLSVRTSKCVLRDNVDANDRGVTASYCLTRNKTLNVGMCLTAFLSPHMYPAIISTRIHNNEFLNMSHEPARHMMHFCAFQQMEKEFLQYYFFLLKTLFDHR
jgi:hypothetical protein